MTSEFTLPEKLSPRLVGIPRAAPLSPRIRDQRLCNPCKGEYAPHTHCRETAAETPLTPTPTFGGKGRVFPPCAPFPLSRVLAGRARSTLGTLQSAQCCFAHKLRPSKHRSFPHGRRVWGNSLLVRFRPFLEATSSNFRSSSDTLFRVFVKSALNLRPLGGSCSISGLLIRSWGSCQTWGDGGTCTGHLGRSLDQLGLGELRPPQGTDRS